jgi:predicted metal-binding membrane protein
MGSSPDLAVPDDPATRLTIGGALVILSGLAWAWTVAMAAMPECHVLALGSFVVMWTVMMAAMMFPSVIPVVLAFATFSRSRGESATLAATLFVLGYLVVWGALGVPAHWLLVAVAGLRDATPRLAAFLPALGGVMLIACGLYQLTPLKDACLNHCRVPHLFLGHHWRDGLGGAFLLGAHHGLYCAGCCASLMVVLMVVGLMNMVWMVGLSIVIYLEKIVPRGSLVVRAAGVALCAAGVQRLVA